MTLIQESAAPQTTHEVLPTTFHTTEIRHWDDLRGQTCKPVSIDDRRSYLPPPLGLNSLDIACGTNVRVRAYASNPHQTGFTVHIDTWGDTKLHSGGCTWFDEALYDPDYSFGTFSTSEHGHSYNPRHGTSQYVNFSRPYATPPRVVVWLTEFDMSHNRHYRIKTYTSEVTGKGFRVHIGTWSDTILYSAAVSWIAVPRDKPGAATGQYSTNDIRHWKDARSENAGAAAFGGHTFSKAPKVYAGLTSLDIDCGRNLRMRAWYDDVTKHGMTWHLDAWGDTIVYSAGGAYIAIA